jgi:hypothetical protein
VRTTAKNTVANPSLGPYDSIGIEKLAARRDVFSQTILMANTANLMTVIYLS